MSKNIMFALKYVILKYMLFQYFFFLIIQKCAKEIVQPKILLTLMPFQTHMTLFLPQKTNGDI